MPDFDGTSISNYGAVTTPVAGQVFCSLVLPLGAPQKYDLYLSFYIDGTTAVADEDNIGLRSNGAVLNRRLVYPLIAASAVLPALVTNLYYPSYQLGVPASGIPELSIGLSSVGNATAGATYHGLVVAVPLLER